jgi:hypothetical protein
VWENGMSYTKDEIEAFQNMLPALGAAVSAQGIGAKAFNDLTKDEVLALCAATVRGFREALAVIYDLESDIPF